jgi:hypothetical protein
MADEEKDSSGSKGRSGGTTLHTVWPMSAFEGEGFPTITLEGTDCTSAEAKAAQEAAEANGVTLVEGGS